ncbi:hypothetical protein NQ315_008530 [Exocentrus adspersus]|uniref:CLIP domain-containing serine protease n=1 Tax=Exocentrus adspersus TaxID=1586481 RepID=A0AAV8W6E8_9CUCU|nr:hypothetical protein NQ315_008530 [Exocentrus adspersus]
MLTLSCLLLSLIGDSCSLASGSPGLCKFLTDCAPALKLVNEGNFPTDLCNSGDSQFVVCCEDTNPVTTPPPEPVRQEVPEPAIVTEYTVTERKAGEISQKNNLQLLQILPKNFLRIDSNK